MLIINDVHIGFQRKGGTTPATQETLRTYLLDSLSSLLKLSDEKDLLVAGDLFDDFEVSPRDWLAAYNILGDWLSRGRTLTLVAGNHDHSPRANKVSSFEMLSNVLKAQFPALAQVFGIGEWDVHTSYEFGIVSHYANQDLFDMALGEILALRDPPRFLFLHANYDNNFAVESDHSLNVSAEMAKQFEDRGVTLVFAHEHQSRKPASNVVVLGNQWPTSVSDCLNNGTKTAHVLNASGLTKVQTWDENDHMFGFHQVDWRSLADTNLSGFVKVIGNASSNEASDAVNAVAAFRQRSDAFVITNGVKVEGIVEAQELPEQFEAAKRFDVMEYIKQHLDEREIAAVEQLMKD